MNRKIERVLLSVSNREGLDHLARFLCDSGVELWASSGTGGFLKGEGVTVRIIDEITGFTELLGGRVKTIHPKILGAILALRDDPRHTADLDREGIKPFDLVVCNLYPFQEGVIKETPPDKAMELIDIGGVNLLRASAKNHKHVLVLSSPDQYESVIAELSKSGLVPSDDLKRRLAFEAIRKVAAYDSAISAYFQHISETAASADSGLPTRLILDLEIRTGLRYGENPHQEAALYLPASTDPMFKQLWGKELSYNNLCDADTALRITAFMGDVHFCCIVKHQIPCGASYGSTLKEAYEKSLAGDPLSAFGGIVSFGSPLDTETAKALLNTFYEVVVAPAFEEGSLDALKTKKNLRVIEVEPLNKPASFEGPRAIKGTFAGYLFQGEDSVRETKEHLRLMAGIEAAKQSADDILFGLHIIRFIRSNSVILVKDRSLIGVGAGQTSRIDALEIAIRKAGDRAEGTVLVSDAFFPFRDSIDRAAEAGIRIIASPSGSVRDEEVVQAAKEKGLTLYFVPYRHFTH